MELRECFDCIYIEVTRGNVTRFRDGDAV